MEACTHPRLNYYVQWAIVVITIKCIYVKYDPGNGVITSTLNFGSTCRQLTPVLDSSASYNC